jgi:serine phosphatase RsbU (regulator of sigma subunit)
MRRRIVHELERSEAARQALEQRGPVVLGLSRHLAPRTSAPVAGVRYAATLRAAEGLLAGDWVDVLELGGDKVALMLLDVSGHGAAAGLEAMRLKTVLTTALLAGRQPHEAMALAADGMAEDERFATAVIAVLDTVTGRLQWANAGHLAPRLVPLNVSVVTPDTTSMLVPTGPLLSSLPGAWSTRSGALEVGQMLMAFSDGLTEARNAAGEEFGIDGVCRALSQTRVRDVDTAVSVCLAAVDAYAVDLHRDDITLVAITRDPGSVRPRDDDQGGQHEVGGRGARSR